MQPLLVAVLLILQQLPIGGDDEELSPGIMIEEENRAMYGLKQNKVPGFDDFTAEDIQTSTDGEGLHFVKRSAQQRSSAKTSCN